MRQSLLALLRCPRCGHGPLRLGRHTSMVVGYARGAIEEVKDGAVECGCGLSLPVEDYVLSYDALLPEDSRAAAGHWAELFRIAWTHGVEGDFDYREPVAPLLWWGVIETAPQPEGDRPGPHATLADHPLLRGRRRILDIGCGPGASSLFLARRGYEVVAIDPSIELVRRAKARAITTGTFVEYVCGQLGTIAFRDASFEAAFALGSLHHLPELRPRMIEIHRLLAPDGVLAVDDHHRAYPHATAVAQAVWRWAEATLGSRWKAVDPAVVAGIEQKLAPYKCLSLGDTLPEAQRLFHIRHLETRHAFLDAFRMVYYLHRDRSPQSFETAGEIVALLSRAWAEAAADWVEQITFIGEKAGPLRVRRDGRRRGNPQHSVLRRVAYRYWQDGPGAVWQRALSRLPFLGRR